MSNNSCQICGAPLSKGSRFCPNCGASLDLKDCNASNIKKERKEHKHNILIIISVLVLLLAGATSYYVLNERQKAKIRAEYYRTKAEEEYCNLENLSLLDRHLRIQNDTTIDNKTRGELYVLLLLEENNDTPWKEKKITQRLREIFRERNK